jgi:D-amino-acid oxidase
MTNRRQFLQTTSAIGFLASALSGCASSSLSRLSGESVSAPLSLLPRPRSSLPFARADITLDNLRVLVGLRPYRASGFVLRADRLYDKTIVHNYGHGGAGITLSWGCALHVRDLVATHRRTEQNTAMRVAVIGAGVIGLTTAHVLQQAGYAVTIYANRFTPDTTSDIAGGQFAPTGLASREFLDAAFDKQLRDVLTKSHAQFASLIGHGYGVNWRENYQLLDDPLSGSGRVPSYITEYPTLFPDAAILRRGQHPFDADHVARNSTLLIEPPVFLSRLMRDITHAGGAFVQRAFDTVQDVAALPEGIIINCTGLGAAALFSDDQMIPVRGQVVIAPPDARVDFLTHGGGNSLLYMFPRTDGILMGGTFERGVGDTRVDDDTTARIVSAHRRLFAGMRV